MNPQRHALAREVFLQAISVPQGDRSEFLERKCVGDDALRAEVEKLLVFYDETEQTDRAIESNLAGSETLATPAGKSSAAAVAAASKRNSAVAPGTVLAGRYRIEALQGFGGMGAVYRALDLTLNMPVAIKILDAHFAQQPDWIERFRNEVRLARAVTHPNVCRVFDIAETDGLVFLSMELIEGEDLANLLQREVKPPIQKAIDIARQVCTGLAAAHGAHVLHRDLKPANVMVSANGNVWITDFGIAVAAKGKGRELRVGTPAYMAPEQIAGRGVDARSDIYSLGLVLYELFSGQPAFRADTVDEYLDLHENAEPKPLSSIAPELDPGLEQIVHWCLRKDPNERPQSPLSVAAELPGVDVLAVALAADQMPAPELVAAAPGSLVSVRRCSGLAAFVIVACLSLPWLRSVSDLPWDYPGAKPVESLVERAREVFASEEHPPRSYEAFGFCSQSLVPKWLKSPAMGVPQIGKKEGRPELLFWYRSAPYPLIPEAGATLVLGDSRVSLLDPPIVDARERVAILDQAGRFIGQASIVDRSRNGSNDSSGQAGMKNPSQDAMRVFSIMVLCVCVPIAWRNYISSRGDRLGAIKASAFVFVIHFVAWALGAGHAENLSYELTLMTVAILKSLGFASIVMIVYLALEPLSRRYWPHMLIGWTRLIRLGVSDSLVWRHALIGLALGCFWALLLCGEWATVRFLGWTPNEPYLMHHAADRLVGGRAAVAASLMTLVFGMTQGILFATPLGIARSVLREPVLSAVAVGLLLFPVFLTRGAHFITSIAFLGLGVAVLGLWTMIRYGLLTIVVASTTAMFLNAAPLRWTENAGMNLQASVVLMTVCAAAIAAWCKGKTQSRIGSR